MLSSRQSFEVMLEKGCILFWKTMEETIERYHYVRKELILIFKATVLPFLHNFQKDLQNCHHSHQVPFLVQFRLITEHDSVLSLTGQLLVLQFKSSKILTAFLLNFVAFLIIITLLGQGSILWCIITINQKSSNILPCLSEF